MPTTVFEFLSDATKFDDRNKKVGVYLRDMGVQEYFIHQPDMERPIEFRGWRRRASGDIVEIAPDAQGGLFSEALNLYFRWENQLDTHVRLLRPYLPDGTPITTSTAEHHLRVEAEERRTENASVDVNGDSSVNVSDVLLVIEALDDPVDAAAPARSELVTTLDPAQLIAQIAILRAQSEGSIKYDQAIAFFQSLLASIRPAETRLLGSVYIV